MIRAPGPHGIAANPPALGRSDTGGQCLSGVLRFPEFSELQTRAIHHLRTRHTRGNLVP